MNAAIHPRPAAERAPSYYAATLNEETDYPTLLGAVTVDIAIIGGGFTGVATAVELAERGYKVALVETHRIGWGASGRNGGQVTSSLSGDAAMHKQMRQWLGAEVEDFIWQPVLARPRDHPPAGGEVRHRLRPSPWPPARGDEGQPHGRAAGLLRGGGAPRHGRPGGPAGQGRRPGPPGDRAVLRRAEEHPQHAPAPAQPVHRRGQGGGRPRRADLRTFRGAGYRPRPAAGGDYPRGKDRGAADSACRRCLPQARTQAAQGDDLPGHGRNRYHPAAGRAGTEINPQGLAVYDCRFVLDITAPPPTAACCSVAAPTTRAATRGTSPPSCGHASSAPSRA